MGLDEFVWREYKVGWLCVRREGTSNEKYFFKFYKGFSGWKEWLFSSDEEDSIYDELGRPSLEEAWEEYLYAEIGMVEAIKNADWEAFRDLFNYANELEKIIRTRFGEKEIAEFLENELGKVGVRIYGKDYWRVADGLLEEFCRICIGISRR